MMASVVLLTAAGSGIGAVGNSAGRGPKGTGQKLRIDGGSTRAA